MKTLEALLREHTWFTEGSTNEAFRNAGTLGEGWLERYGIDAAVHELNVNWIAGLNDYPSAATGSATASSWRASSRLLRRRQTLTLADVHRKRHASLFRESRGRALFLAKDACYSRWWGDLGTSSDAGHPAARGLRGAVDR